jgi:nitronate monooxygenase
MISLRNGFDGLRRNASFEQQPKYAEAREAGDTNVAAVIVGEAVDLVHTEETASYIVSRICSDAETLLGGTCRFLVPGTEHE